MNITSAAGVISLLDESESALKVFSLKKLNIIVDEFWAEISEAIEKIEILYEQKTFPERELAALVASKVYYHLGSFDDSLTYALGAGALFDIDCRSQYVDTMVAKCIDHYTRLRVERDEQAAGASVDVSDTAQPPIDSRLEAIVNRMLEKCFLHGQFQQALGIGLETRRMDVVKRAILDSPDASSSLHYAFTSCMALLQHRGFRKRVLRQLVALYEDLATPDYVSMCQCLIFLDDATACAQVLDRLVKESEDAALMSYQMAFDLYDSATQQFIARVLQSLSTGAPLPDKVLEPGSTTTTTTTTTSGTAADSEGDSNKPADDKNDAVSSLTTEQAELQARYEKLSSILCGDVAISLHLQFLVRANHTDLTILKQVKDTVRASVCHTAVVTAHGLMQCGTTNDQFLRDSLEWLSRAYSWAKMSATASLGVIHRGHEADAMQLMHSYLPKDSSTTSAGGAAGSGSGYTESGALYALGLIHANHGRGLVADYLLRQLTGASSEVVRHGACLGLGLSAMGTHRADVYDQLKQTLYQDDAVSGEAAGLAMGLVMMASKNAAVIEDMLTYAHETQHEKIVRGLAVGVALTMYERLEEADSLVASLCSDQDAVLRRSGVYTLAMAYCGSGNNQALRRLLHYAVSDVSDDVRRAAVIGVGFVLCHRADQCPPVVLLLAESYNPHVRYGAAMALGVACAGSGNREALALLEPLCFDMVNFVRQGALIASAMVLIQHTDSTSGNKVDTFRQLYSKVVGDKHEDVMAKLGAILAKGIIDAGGRNCTLALLTRSGHNHVSAVAGMLLFVQYWFWLPLAHCISLALSPTCVVALNSQLRMPCVSFISAAPASMYGYPPPLETKRRDEREKVATAVLSVTARANRNKSHHHRNNSSSSDRQQQQQRNNNSSSQEQMELDDDTQKDAVQEKHQTSGTGSETAGDKKPVSSSAAAGSLESGPGAASTELLANPARVLRQQLRVLRPTDECRYSFLKELRAGGVIMVRDLKANDPTAQQAPLVDWVMTQSASGSGQTGISDEDDEPSPPEPFEYEE